MIYITTDRMMFCIGMIPCRHVIFKNYISGDKDTHLGKVGGGENVEKQYFMAVIKNHGRAYGLE
jgi:hypothetical protein